MAYSDDVLRYNTYGKEYEVPRRRVFFLSELQRGDRIAFYRLQGIYWHHAIVKHVDEESGEIKTIEYNRTPSGKFQVMEKTHRFEEVTVYLILHGSFKRDLVLWRAQSKIGEEKYNLVTNNCEHFAMWCITGRSSCDQINKGLEMVNEEVGQRLVSKAATRAEAKIAARSASHTGRAIMRAEVGSQLVSKGAEMKGKLAVQSASHTGRVIMRTGITQSMAQNGLTTMALDAGTGVGGILAERALAVAFEGLSMAFDIGKEYGDLKTRRIDRKGYDKTVGKRVVTGASSVAGSTIGMAAGQALIPVPAVGAAIGCLAGALVGRFLGNLTGNIIYGNDSEDGDDYYEAEDKKYRIIEITCCT